MKNIFKKYYAYIVALIVISTLAFAGARYEIYRLSPAPKSGQIIGEKNGKWAAIAGAESLNSLIKTAEYEGYNLFPIAVENSMTSEYELRAWTPDGIIYANQTLGTGITTNGKGRAVISCNGLCKESLDNYGYVPFVYANNDTTGIVINYACLKDSSFEVVVTRADTLLKSTALSVTAHISPVVNGAYLTRNTFPLQ